MPFIPFKFNSFRLKAEQQLSIDFHTFPSILIELINETTDSSPSKRIEVTCHTLRANLSIVEPRKIRNITELNLELLPADDSEQKVYLASSLKQLQTESAESVIIEKYAFLIQNIR